MKDNHHYVPQFYLRHFSHNKKSIATYIIDNSHYIQYANIKGQASKKKLYGNSDDIENVLMTLEHKVSITINNMINTLEFPNNESGEYHELLYFLMISSSRVTKEAENSSSMIDKFYKLLMKMDSTFDITEEELDSFRIGADIPNVLPMHGAGVSYPALLDLKPIFLVSECDRQFISSDSPVTRYNLQAVKRSYHLRGYGLSSAGLMLFFPLTPKIMVLLYDSAVYDLKNETDNVLRIKRGKDIDELNKLTFLDAYKYLYFNSKLSINYIKRITKNMKPTFTIENNFSQYPVGDGMIIGMHNPDTREKINLSFVKVNKYFMECKLPDHMKGLTRPLSEMLVDATTNFNFR